MLTVQQTHHQNPASSNKQGVQWYLASLPESFYLAHIAADHTTPDFMRFLRLRLQALVGSEFDAYSFVFGLRTLSTGMAMAGYDGVTGRATVGRPTSSGAGEKEDHLCRRTLHVETRNTIALVGFQFWYQNTSPAIDVLLALQNSRPNPASTL